MSARLLTRVSGSTYFVGTEAVKSVPSVIAFASFTGSVFFGS